MWERTFLITTNVKRAQSTVRIAPLPILAMHATLAILKSQAKLLVSVTSLYRVQLDIIASLMTPNLAQKELTILPLLCHASLAHQDVENAIKMGNALVIARSWVTVSSV